MEVLKLVNINKSYKNKSNSLQVLKEFSMNVNLGEIVGIVGTSGSGKTTLLNIIGLIDSDFEGELYIDDVNISSCNEKELAKLRNQKIGFVLQDFALIERYNVSQNVELPLIYSKIKRKERRKISQKYLEKMGIADKTDSKPSELSGGEKQRVAIARSLATEPKIILADEPTGSLDYKTTDEIMEVLEMLRDSNRAIILVTHDMNIAKRCDRIINIDKLSL